MSFNDLVCRLIIVAVFLPKDVTVKLTLSSSNAKTSDFFLLLSFLQSGTTLAENRRL
jgi:hypothetical protein